MKTPICSYIFIFICISYFNICLYYICKYFKSTDIQGFQRDYVSTQPRQNKRGLVATFHCSRAPLPRVPWTWGFPLPDPPARGPGLWGLAARKCCYQTFLISPSFCGKVMFLVREILYFNELEIIYV